MAGHCVNALVMFMPGAVAQSEASSLGMQAAPSSIPTFGTFFRGDLVMKTFLRHSPSSARRHAQEQCG